MAVLISRATGNLTSSSTWGLVDSTSYLNSESANTALTTSYQASSTFTPGAITIDGIAVKLAVRTGTTGTISVHLAIAGVEVTGTLVTINTADLPPAVLADLNGGWIFFEFASPVLLVAATNYTVEARTSSASQVTLFSASGTNWSRVLSTTTNQAPTTGDDMIICGEFTGAGTSNTFTVTMDSTAATDYGAASTSLVTPAMAICSKGVLSFGTSSTTNYVLRLSGHCITYSNGIYNEGTTGTPIPRGSTGWLEFDCATDGDFGYTGRINSTNSIQFLSRTSGKNVFSCKLNTDEAANSTSLGVDTDTGWLDNDEIVIASTSRTYTETEKGALNGNANTSDMTVDGFAGTAGGLLNAHLGSSSTNGSMQAEIILLTRSGGIRSVSSTAMSFVNFKSGAFVDVDWARFRYCGENVAGKRGVEIETTVAGSCSIQFSVIDDCEDGGLYVAGSATSGWVFSSNVMYNCDSALLTHSVRVEATSGTWTMDSNLFIFCGGLNNDRVVRLDDIGGVFTNNTAAGCNAGDNGSSINLNQAGSALGTFSGNIAHSNRGAGIRTNAGEYTGVILNCKGWRNTIEGFSVHERTYEGYVEGFEAWGNGSRNFLMQAGSNRMRFYNCKLNSDATLSTTQGVLSNGSGIIEYYNCDFGNNFSLSQPIFLQDTQFQRHYAFDCTFDSDTVGVIQDGSGNNVAGLFIENFDDTIGDCRNFFRNGTIFSETSVRHTASGRAWNMDPSTASRKLILPGPTPSDVFKFAANEDQAITLTVWVRKNAAYNGNAPRLVLVGGIVAGVGSFNTPVTDSLTVGADTWEQLSVTATPTENGTCEWYVDCDGTAGNVYVDDAHFEQA